MGQRASCPTRCKNGQGIWGRIKPEGRKSLPAALSLLTSKACAQLQVGEAALPMVINPAPLLCLNDACTKTGQIERGKGQAEQQAFQGVGGRKATFVKLEAARLVIAEALLHIEA